MYYYIHALCFISNDYKQRFLELVKCLKKLSNRTKGQEISKANFLETPLPKKQAKFFEGFLP